jgi:hypothetical protein
MYKYTHTHRRHSHTFEMANSTSTTPPPQQKSAYVHIHTYIHTYTHTHRRQPHTFEMANTKSPTPPPQQPPPERGSSALLGMLAPSPHKPIMHASMEQRNGSRNPGNEIAKPPRLFGNRTTMVPANGNGHMHHASQSRPAAAPSFPRTPLGTTPGITPYGSSMYPRSMPSTPGPPSGGMSTPMGATGMSSRMISINSFSRPVPLIANSLSRPLPQSHMGGAQNVHHHGGRTVPASIALSNAMMRTPQSNVHGPNALNLGQPVSMCVTRVCLCVCVCVHTCVCAYMCVCVCIHTWSNVHGPSALNLGQPVTTSIDTYVHIHTHIHTNHTYH